MCMNYLYKWLCVCWRVRGSSPGSPPGSSPAPHICWTAEPGVTHLLPAWVSSLTWLMCTVCLHVHVHQSCRRAPISLVSSCSHRSALTDIWLPFSFTMWEEKGKTKQPPTLLWSWCWSPADTISYCSQWPWHLLSHFVFFLCQTAMQCFLCKAKVRFLCSRGRMRSCSLSALLLKAPLKLEAASADEKWLASPGNHGKVYFNSPLLTSVHTHPGPNPLTPLSGIKGSDPNLAGIQQNMIPFGSPLLLGFMMFGTGSPSTFLWRLPLQMMQHLHHLKTIKSSRGGWRTLQVLS